MILHKLRYRANEGLIHSAKNKKQKQKQKQKKKTKTKQNKNKKQKKAKRVWLLRNFKSRIMKLEDTVSWLYLITWYIILTF